MRRHAEARFASVREVEFAITVAELPNVDARGAGAEASVGSEAASTLTAGRPPAAAVSEWKAPKTRASRVMRLTAMR